MDAGRFSTLRRPRPPLPLLHARQCVAAGSAPWLKHAKGVHQCWAAAGRSLCCHRCCNSRSHCHPTSQQPPLCPLPPSQQEALGVEPLGSRYEACSSAVGAALGPDVMQSVKRLVPDLLEAYPVLLYQGECRW